MFVLPGYAPPSGLYTPVSGNLFNSINSTPLSLTPQQQQQQQQSSFIGPFIGGSSTPSATMGSGGSIGRDSMDYKPRPFGQYYSTMGAPAMSPNNPMGFGIARQSLTPPPSMSGSSPNIAFGGNFIL